MGGAGWAAAAGLAEGAEAAPTVVARLLYLAAVVAGGWYVAPKAWLALVRRTPDMNLLMTLAVAGAIGIGEWLEAATVAFLFALSLALESWSVGRARRAVAALLELAPTTVRRLLPDGSAEEVAAAEVAVGTRFLVRPGERVPLDGLVVTGRSDVDASPITGESVPVARAPGDEVFAGTINGRAALEVESTRAAGQTALARILRRVEEARSRRSPPSSGSSASRASTRPRSSRRRSSSPSDCPSRPASPGTTPPTGRSRSSSSAVPARWSSRRRWRWSRRSRRRRATAC